ncbi:hypothetical protein QCA50_020291 [Cerrena zonata]|uniref:Uncharacterized protein n=1 Tax=Cerrena zonata TaxID=2478898 RepID=A0AAW0F9B7_9APHY
MMYVSVYPIAMSVRSTNVYEEKSLGIFPETESLDEDRFSLGGTRATVLGRYLGMHMRKQLSFDMWWLGLALFLVCIIERDGLDNAANSTWFSIFTILFELVSAYGTVGLSLGVPYANYSFSGSLRPLSKLIVCVVMLRGRHRGLPVAIDRAIMVPVHSEISPDGISEEPTMLPDEAFINGEILQNGDYIREKSPPPAQEHGLIHRRRGSVMSAMSDGQRICEGPRRTNTIITIEEPEP